MLWRRATRNLVAIVAVFATAGTTLALAVIPQILDARRQAQRTRCDNYLLNLSVPRASQAPRESIVVDRDLKLVTVWIDPFPLQDSKRLGIVRLEAPAGNAPIPILTLVRGLQALDAQRRIPESVRLRRLGLQSPAVTSSTSVQIPNL